LGCAKILETLILGYSRQSVRINPELLEKSVALADIRKQGRCFGKFRFVFMLGGI